MKYSLLAVGVFCLVATHAIAEQVAAPVGEVKVEMFVLHASTQGKGFDKKLPAKMLKRLSRPPYSAYTKYTLLAQRVEQVTFAKPQLVALPDKSTLRLTVMPRAKRLTIKAEIRKKAGKKFLPVLQTRVRPKQLFFVPGHKFKKGTLMVGMHVLGK